MDNAFYSRLANEVQINVGLLKGSGVGISPTFPRAVMYGGMAASTLGHELVHAFDNSSKNFDGDGRQQNWWDARSEAEFQQRAECMVEQYSSFTVTVAGVDYTPSDYTRIIGVTHEH